MCIEYHIWVNVYHVSAQGVDKRMINVYYYYFSEHTEMSFSVSVVNVVVEDPNT